MPAKIIDISQHMKRGPVESQGFYVPGDAARLARLARSTIGYWAREGIIVPTLSWTNEDGDEREGYSFDDVLYMRLVGLLREKHPMRDVVRALEYLTDTLGPPGPRWSKAVVFSDATNVWTVLQEDKWGPLSSRVLAAATRGGQQAWPELFGTDFRRLQERADALLVPETFARYVEVDPAIRNGAPVVRTTTITTALIHSLMMQRTPIQTIAGYYPVLNQRQVRQADRFEQFLDMRGVAA